MTKTTRARYTLEFKQEAVRLVEGGQSIAAAARTLGVVDQTLFNWVKAHRQGKLKGADSKPHGERRADGDQPAQSRVGAREDGARHSGKSDGVLRKGIDLKYAFIQSHRRVWPISVQCRVLEVSVAGYHEHFVRRASEAQRRHLRDDALLVHIKAMHAETRGGYGWPSIWKELLARGIRVGKDRVQKLMQLHGIRAKGKRRFKVTTDSKHDLPISPNLLDRQFSVAEPDKVWAGDITYIATDEGWLFLAVVIDLFSRQVVGWSLREDMTHDIVIDALRMAWFKRHPAKQAGLIFHSDKGSQYASKDFRDLLAEYGITSSMSRKGNCWDNAPMESVNATLKAECVNDVHFRTREEARQAIVEYIGYYNTERRHSSLGNIAPAEFERRWRGGIETEEQDLAAVRHRVTHRRPVPGSSQAPEPAVRG